MESRQPSTTPPPEPMRWSSPAAETRQSPECSLRIAALLVERSVENRRLRDQACGAVASERAAGDDAATKSDRASSALGGRGKPVMAEPWRALRSAAELTR